MILVDVNLIVYAHNRQSDLHADARRWLEDSLNLETTVALPWQSLLGFLRIITNPRAIPLPWTMSAAWSSVADLLSLDCVKCPSPGPRHAAVLSGLLGQQGIYGNLVSDAHLAALAIEHGLTLCTTDSDFARFKNLRWRNPLAA